MRFRLAPPPTAPRRPPPPAALPSPPPCLPPSPTCSQVLATELTAAVRSQLEAAEEAHWAAVGAPLMHTYRSNEKELGMAGVVGAEGAPGGGGGGAGVQQLVSRL